MALFTPLTLIIVAIAAAAADGWVLQQQQQQCHRSRDLLTPLYSSQQVDAAGSPIAESTTKDTNPVRSDAPELGKTERFLEKKYPSFAKLLLNDELRQALRAGPATVFVPNQAAFDALGDKKLRQLTDPRNLEIVDKVAAHHIVPGEALSATQLLTEDYTKGRPKPGQKANTVIAKVKAYGGVEVPVGRKVTKTGGFLSGIFEEGVPDGDVVIGPDAIIVKSFQVGNETLVHEMSGLVSPVVLWRYFDQLRIPGL